MGMERVTIIYIKSSIIIIIIIINLNYNNIILIF